jgi:hypothetical protein
VGKAFVTEHIGGAYVALLVLAPGLGRRSVGEEDIQGPVEELVDSDLPYPAFICL